MKHPQQIPDVFWCPMERGDLAERFYQAAERRGNDLIVVEASGDVEWEVVYRLANMEEE